MTREDIFKTVDHTLLAQTATWEEIKEICDDAIKYQTASVCIPASYVKRAKDYVDGKMAICTVIGFPNGYSTTAVKEYETKDANIFLIFFNKMRTKIKCSYNIFHKEKRKKPKKGI